MTDEERARADDLIQREMRLKQRLREEYPHDEILLKQTEELVYQVRYAREQFVTMLANMGARRREDPERNLQSEFRRVRFYLGALVSSSSTILGFLYRYRDEPLPGVPKEVLLRIVDAWKKTRATRIVVAMRNKIQHGFLLDGYVIYRKKEPSVRGLTYALDESTWRRLVEVSIAEVQLYYHAQIEPRFDPLGSILEEYERGVIVMVERLRADLNACFDPTVHAARIRLHGDLAAVRAEAKRFWASIDQSDQ